VLRDKVRKPILLRESSLAAALLAGLIIFAAPCATPPLSIAATTPGRSASLAENTDFLIYNPSGTTLLGRAHYVITQRGGSVTIDGRNSFLDGEYDVEHELLKSVAGGLPRLFTYEHSFFDAQGKPQIIARADVPGGKGSCASYHGGKGTTETADLQFPPDTYAGAAVLVPIAEQLRRAKEGLDISVFDCAAGPRLLTLHADLTRSPWRFLPHQGDLAKADARPVFGWFNVFLKPFVPQIRLWFDPLRDYQFVGGTLSRYYRGPEVLLVSIPAPITKPPAFERVKPPVLTMPRDAAPAVPAS
jgi:hypothetical protein